MNENMYVRLKPYNPKVGHNVQRYMVGGQLFVGKNQVGNTRWYKVSRAVADKLGALTQDPNNPDTPPMFDILSEAQYKTVANREKDMKLHELGLASMAAVATGVDRHVQSTLTEVKESRSAALVDDADDADDSDASDHSEKEPAAPPQPQRETVVAEEVSGDPEVDVSDVDPATEPAQKPRRGRRKRS